MAGNTDTLNVGAGLSVDVAFTGGVPMIGDTDGAPYWIIGNRVVVVDPTRLNEETQTVRDLSDGIMASVQNRLTQTGGAGGAQSSTNAFGGLSGPPMPATPACRRRCRMSDALREAGFSAAG